MLILFSINHIDNYWVFIWDTLSARSKRRICSWWWRQYYVRRSCEPPVSVYLGVSEINNHCPIICIHIYKASLHIRRHFCPRFSSTSSPNKPASDIHNCSTVCNAIWCFWFECESKTNTCVYLCIYVWGNISRLSAARFAAGYCTARVLSRFIFGRRHFVADNRTRAEREASGFWGSFVVAKFHHTHMMNACHTVYVFYCRNRPAGKCVN